MENLDLTKILANVPVGTKLYCSLIKCDEGENTNVKLLCADPFNSKISLEHTNNTITTINADGSLYGYQNIGGECILFPSKDNRDWSTFKVEPSVDDIADEYLHKHAVGIKYINDFEPKLQAIIKMLAVADHINEGWVPDWENREPDKTTIYNNPVRGIVVRTGNFYAESMCYFKDEETALKAIEMLGEDCIKTALS